MRCFYDFFSDTYFGIVYNSTIEHNATVIICKMKPNVSESNVGARAKI